MIIWESDLVSTELVTLEKRVEKDKGNIVYWDSNIIKKFTWEKIVWIAKRTKKEFKSPNLRMLNGY